MDERIVALISGANFGHIATVRRDGTAAVNPIWVDLDGENVLVNGTRGRGWTSNLVRAPRVTLSVTALDNPYECATLRGVARPADIDPTAHFDRLFRKYRDGDIPPGVDIGERVLFAIAVEHSRYRFEPGPGSDTGFASWLAAAGRSPDDR